MILISCLILSDTFCDTENYCDIHPWTVSVIAMNSNIFEVSKLWNDTDKMIDFLQEIGVIKQTLNCCGEQATLVKSHCQDGKEFKCYKCDRRSSIQTSTFFFRSRLSLGVLLSLIYFFCAGLSLSQCCQ